MADKKISELTALTTPDGAEELIVNDSGTSKKITIDNVTENNFTDALKTKLDAIEASADVTDATNVAAAGALMKSGGTMTGNVTHSSGYLDMGANHIYLADNAQVKLGTSEDLQIYHDGSNSYIADVGTGDLTIRAGNDLRLQDSNTQAYLTANEGGSVEIYYDNSKKLETTSSGIDVTGSVITSDKVRIVNDTSSKIELGDSGNTSIGKIEYVHSSNDLFFKVNDAERMRIESSGNVGIGTSSPSAVLETKNTTDGSTFAFQATNDNDHEIVQIGAQSDGDGYLTVHGQGATTNIKALIHSDGNSYFNGGNLGIGTSSPSKKLEIAVSGTDGVLMSGANGYVGSTNDLVIDMDSNNDYSGNVIKFTQHNGASELMRIADSGNVGIGTTSPSFPLHVSGKIYSTGVVSSGGNSFELSDNNVTIKRATNDMTLNTAGTERIRINANGNIGIGESTAIRKVVIAGSSGNSSTLLLHMDADTAGGETALQFKGDSTNDDRRIKASIVFRRDNPGTRGTGKLYFNVNGDNNDVNVSTSHAGLVIDASRRIHGGSYTFESGHLNLIGEYGIGYKAMTFSRTNGGGVVGSIVANSSSTSYNTSSDYRLKENVDYTWNATTRLKQLKPARFNWIKDDTNTLVDGFLAHEVSSIVPEAITGDKDAMKDEQYIVTPAVEEVKDANGNITTEAKEAVISTRNVPDYQSIDQSKLVPLLVKTIQELEARITTLENA